MAKQRNAYEIELPDKRTVTLVELKTGELRQAMTLAGSKGGALAQEWDLNLEGLRLSLRAIDGSPVTYDSLQGERWDDLFSMRDTNLLSEAWRQIHLPSEAEVQKVRGNLKAISGPSTS